MLFFFFWLSRAHFFFSLCQLVVDINEVFNLVAYLSYLFNVTGVAFTACRYILRMHSLQVSLFYLAGFGGKDYKITQMISYSK